MRIRTEEVLQRFREWDGDMAMDSVTATIYQTWHYFFFNSLLHAHLMEESLRKAVVNSFLFLDFAQKVISIVDQDPTNLKYNQVCDNVYPEYQGNMSCAYNMARAMADAYQFLEENVSHVVSDWKWGNVHANIYDNFPWSSTSMRNLFRREVPVGGNGYTIKASKVSFKTISTSKTFKAAHV